MTKQLTIVLIGAGNVAWHLGKAFEKAGHTISTVYSRSLINAETLANRLNQAQAIQSLDFTSIQADVYVLAIKDDAVPVVLQHAAFSLGSLVVHTSGSLPLSVFSSQLNIKAGVFYPIQTFSKSAEINLKQTPIGVEATNIQDLEILKSLAASISDQVVELSSEARKIFHLAAVFACNFTNHLLGISHELMTRQQLDFNLLKPLVNETIQKAFNYPPFLVQTGPAVRFDENTIVRHKALLNNNPEYLAVYNKLTQSIQQKAKSTTD